MKRVLNQQTFNAGISESEKEGLSGSCYFSYHINIYRDPRFIELFPAPVKVSGTVITDLIKWIVPATGYVQSLFAYGDTGNIYQQSPEGVWSLLQHTPGSMGQGLEVSNDYLYYTTGRGVGRYGPLDNSPTFNDSWNINPGSYDTQFSPIKQFKEGFAVGHGNKLGWWDGSVWDDAKVLLPQGFVIRSLEVYNEYLVMGTYTGTDITANDTGYLFFWDGSSDTFNFFATASDGGVAALLNSKNQIISFLGADSTFYKAYSPFVKLQQMPKVDITDSVDIYPGAVTNWRSISFFGVAGDSTSDTLLRGVYGYGSRSSKYPDALSFAFSISTGNTGSTVHIGAIKGIGNDLYVCWHDGDNYGVDKISNDAACYSSGYLEQLIFDNNNLYRDKRINRVKSTHMPLTTGQGIQISTSLDRGDYLDGTVNTSGNETNFTPPLQRAKEIQNKVSLTSSSGVSPRVTSFAMLFDDQKSEEQF